MQASRDTLIGRTLDGRYEIQRVAAQEHLGQVYAAVDHREHGPVHVKVLHPSFVHDPRKFARFGREITATWLVSHPNTVEVLDWGQQDDVHYLVTEPVEGPTVADALGAGPLPPERVAPIVAQIASAIGAAHQEGIVHRALVPRNVVLLAGDVVKVRDFGMSKLEDVEDDLGTQTTLTTRVEDLAYMAPEYLDTGNFLKKSDLYSLGALAYQMLTGRTPSTGARMPTPPPSHWVAVPPWLDELVVALLDPEPNGRPGAYKVVQRIEAGTGRSVEPVRPQPPEEVPVDGPSSIAIFGGVALLLAVLAVGGVVIVSSGVALLVTLWVSL